MATSAQRKYALALRALAWLLLARLSLALLPLNRALGVMDVKRGTASVDPREVAWAIHAVARRIPGTHCLPRSLALHAMLRRGGHASALRIGVRRAGAGIAAHAWVTCGGRAIDGDP